MKKLVYLFFVITALFAGCKKDGAPKLTQLASLNVTNAVVGGATLTLNTSELTVGNQSFAQLTLVAGNSLVDLYPAGNPSSPYYNQSIQTANGSYYSLFLTGSSPSAIDKILIKESYANYADSVCGVRFINLSTGSIPISVNVTGSANGSTVQSLAYKSYSGFIKFAAKATDATYSFDFRDAATGALVATYTLSTPYFNNVTLALTGIPGGQSILQVNNY